MKMYNLSKNGLLSHRFTSRSKYAARNRTLKIDIWTIVFFFMKVFIEILFPFTYLVHPYLYQVLICGELLQTKMSNLLALFIQLIVSVARKGNQDKIFGQFSLAQWRVEFPLIVCSVLWVLIWLSHLMVAKRQSMGSLQPSVRWVKWDIFYSIQNLPK